MDLNALQGADKVVGSKQTVKALSRGELQIVFVAHDTDERVAMPVLDLCEANHVPVERSYSMEELGKACHIKVKAATVGVRK